MHKVKQVDLRSSVARTGFVETLRVVGMTSSAQLSISPAELTERLLDVLVLAHPLDPQLYLANINSDDAPAILIKMLPCLVGRASGEDSAADIMSGRKPSSRND